MLSKKLKRQLFKAYLLLPGSKFVFSVIKTIGIPPYNLRKFLRFRGSFVVSFDKQLSLKMMSYGNTIENELFWLGSKGWENFASGSWRLLSEQSRVIIDIGANTGLYSLLSAKVNPGATVYAFEPLEVVYNRLQTNLKLNNLHVHTHQLALADDEGSANIFVADTISETFDQASLTNNIRTSKMNALVVKKRMLSTFIEEEGITQIDLMKIDVEMFEPNVLRGMGKYLKLFAPSILIEILNVNVGKEVENLVQDIGYSFYQIDEKKGFKKTDSLVPPKNGSNFLLLNKQKWGHDNILSRLMVC